MRRILTTLCAMGMCLLLVSPLYAGGIINKQNQSADYIRTLNRHAATDYADIAVYNPAGTMQMADGAYVKVDAMYFNKDYSNTVPDGYGNFTNQSFGELSQDEPSIIPGAFAVYKQKKWSGFFAFSIPAGGGKLDYTDGSARTVVLADGIAGQANAQLGAGGVPATFFYNQIDDMSIEVKESTVYGFTLGGSYAITDMWSVALGARYSTGTRDFDGSVTISAANNIPTVNDPVTGDLRIKQEADGWCGIVGVNFKPNDKLNTALTYISRTNLNYKNDVKTDTLGLADQIGFADGSGNRIDIPALLGFGISYKIIDPLKVDLNYVYYFEKEAKIDTFEGEGDSWDLGVTAEYRFMPQLAASLGYLRTDIDLKDDEQINEPEEPKLDANTISAGLVWNPVPDLAVTFAGLKVWYDSVTDSDAIKYEKDVWSLALGVQYKFL